MKWIDYSSPNTIDEAISILSGQKGKARSLAGGTDLIVQMRAAPQRVNNPDIIVDIKSIPELNQVEFGSDGLTIGAAVPCYKIYQNDKIADAYPGLIDSASLIGGTQIQGRASLGGNLCNSAPSGDAIPTLIAHNVTCTIAGPKGERTVSAEDFCTGPGKNILDADEILVSLHFPTPPKGFGARYIRFIPRNEMDIAVVGAGVSVILDPSGKISNAKIALASVAPTPILINDAADALIGQEPTESAVNNAGKIARNSIKPITDMRGTVEFRQQLSDVLTRRALNDAITRAKGGSINDH